MELLVARWRRILTAELLSIGSELTRGDTRDTNAGELARSLSDAGVEIVRLTAVPDQLPAVRDALEAALGRADLVISTGGLGPTPDDLTREAIASLAGETPTVDRELETWLRGLWARRGMAFPEMNLKQAWLIPSADAIPNPNGTAPGWWVERPNGRIIVALPGPPREMWAMWAERALPQLRERGLGRDQVTRTYRLAGIGESQVADLLGDGLLRTRNPSVATYARAEAVDVRISAVPEEGRDGRPGRSPEELVDEAEAVVLGALASYVWGRDDETWSAAIGHRLDALGWTLATHEIGTGGTLGALLGGAPWLLLSEAAAAWTQRPPATPGRDALGEEPAPEAREAFDAREALEMLATEVRRRGSSNVGLALRIAPRHDDTSVEIAVATPRGVHHVRRLAFLGGPQGRSRAALLGVAALLEELRSAARDVDLHAPFANARPGDAGHPAPTARQSEKEMP